MDYIDFLKTNKFDRMPKEKKLELKKRYITDNYGSALLELDEKTRESELQRLNDAMLETESKFISSSLGLKVPVDKQTDLNDDQKKLYQQKVVEDYKNQAPEIDDGTEDPRSFTSFAKNLYNAVSTDIKKNPQNVLNIANLLNPAMVSKSIEYLGSAASAAQYKQAEDYTADKGDDKIKGADFPLVAFGEGVRKSGPQRLINTFVDNSPPDIDVPGEGKIRTEGKPIDYEFTDRAGKVIYGLGAITPDLPLFLTGPIKGFALSKMISSWAEEREKSQREGTEITFGDMTNVLKETGKGVVTGAALGWLGRGTGALTGMLTSKISNSLMQKGLPALANSAEKIANGIMKFAETGIEAGALMVGDAGMNAMMPTNKEQREAGFNPTFDDYINSFLTIGVMKAGAKLKSTIIDPVTLTKTNPLDAAIKFRDIVTEINDTYSSGKPEIINKIFTTNLAKKLTAAEVKTLSEVSGKTPTEILNMTPAEFTKVAEKYNNKNIDTIIDFSTEQLKILDQDISQFQKIELRDRLLKELEPGKTRSQIADETKIETKMEPTDQFVGDSFIAAPKKPSLPVLDSTLDIVYGQGSKQFYDAAGKVKEFISGKDSIINEQFKNGSDIVVVEANTPKEYNMFTGKNESRITTTTAPLSRGQVEVIKNVPDMPKAPITGNFQTFGKRLRATFEPLYDLVIEPIRDAKALARQNYTTEVNNLKTVLKDINASSSEIKNVKLKMVSEQISGKETLERMKMLDKVPAELNAKEQKLYAYVKGRYQEFLGIYNTSRILSGKDPIGTTENYAPLMRKFTIREKLGFSEKKEGLDTQLFIDDFLAKDSAFFSKSREFSDRAVELDLVGEFSNYAREMYAHAYMMPVTAKIKKLMSPFKTVDGEVVDLARDKPNTYEYLLKGIEYLEGVPQHKNTVFNNMMRVVSKNMGRSILGGNYQSVASQMAASWGMLTEMPFEAIKNMDKVLSIKSQREMLAKSRHMSGRLLDASVSDAAGKPTATLREAIKDPIGTITKSIFAPMRLMDYTFASWGWQTAYARGKKLYPGDDVQAIRYADRKTIDWNASAAKEDLSAIQRTPAGKAFTLFQTAPINQINWIARDIVGIKSKRVDFEGDKIRPKGTETKIDWSQSMFRDPKKFVNFIKLAALSEGLGYLYEDVLGLYSPLPRPIAKFLEKDKDGNDKPVYKSLASGISEVLSLFPVGSMTEWGPSSLYGAQLWEFAKFAEALAGTMGGKKWNRAGEAELLQSSAIILGVPGSKAFIKEWRKYKKAEKEIEKMEAYDPMKAQKMYRQEHRRMLKEVRNVYKNQFKGDF